MISRLVAFPSLGPPLLIGAAGCAPFWIRLGPVFAWMLYFPHRTLPELLAWPVWARRCRRVLACGGGFGPCGPGSAGVRVGFRRCAVCAARGGGLGPCGPWLALRVLAWAWKLNAALKSCLFRFWLELHRSAFPR